MFHPSLLCSFINLNPTLFPPSCAIPSHSSFPCYITHCIPSLLCIFFYVPTLLPVLFCSPIPPSLQSSTVAHPCLPPS
ncbi:hypothetical protein Nmel_014873, partial [Mimus melanotis]